MKRVTVGILFLMVMVGLMVGTHAPNASATLLAPGSSAVPSASSGFGDTIIDSIINAPFTADTGRFSGLLSALVVRETTSGNLDFYYQITNNITSLDAINRSTDYVFVGFTTDVYYRSDTNPFGYATGTSPPINADRNSIGATVGFDFGTANLLPGLTSNWFFIATDAKYYTIGGTSVIDGGIASLGTFAPSAIPLPPTVLLLGTGLVGLVGIRYRRKRQG